MLVGIWRKNRLFAGVWDIPGMLRMQHCESPKPFWFKVHVAYPQSTVVVLKQPMNQHASKGKNSIQLKWKYPPDQALHQELREEWEKHKLKGNCKTIFIILQEHPLVISWSVHEACYRFRGAAEGGKLKGKEPNPPQCTRSKLRLLQRACLNQPCMPARFYLLDKHGTSSSIIVAIHKRDPWCFHVYPCS